MKKSIIVFVALVSVVTAACGSSETSLPTSPSAPTSPAPAPVPAPAPAPVPVPVPAPGPGSPFTQSISGSADRFEHAFHDFTAPRAGTATITVSWASGRDDLDLALSEATCRIDEVNCPTIAEAPDTAQVDGTSEQLSAELTEGQTVRIWVSNFRPRVTSYTVRIEIR
jgi:hypothetical protein